MVFFLLMCLVLNALNASLMEEASSHIMANVVLIILSNFNALELTNNFDFSFSSLFNNVLLY